MAKFDKNKFDKVKTLGETVKEYRNAKGLLLREIAAAINVDTAMISKFEKGERKPTREQIIALARVLEINEKELLIIYLSDKVAFDLKDEEVAKQALKIAEKKIALLQKTKNRDK